MKARILFHFSCYQNGCKAVLIVDNSAADLTPPGLATDVRLTLPVVMVTQQDGEAIITEIEKGESTVSMSIQVHSGVSMQALLEVRCTNTALLSISMPLLCALLLSTQYQGVDLL